MKLGYGGAPSHDGIIQHLAKIQSLDGKGPETSVKRNAWAKVGHSVEDKGEVYYFAGCLPLYEVMFEEYEPEEYGVYAVYPHSRYLAAKVRTFVDFLVRYFSREEA